MTMRRALRLMAAITRDRRGSVLPVMGVCLAAMVGACGLAVDLGSLFLARQRLQNAVDLAALSSAANGGDEAVARQVVRDNGVTATAVSVTRGSYAANPDLPSAVRFQPGGTSPNAVRVEATAASPLHFSRVFLSRPSLMMTAGATAEQADLASVGIGARVASLQAGLLNAVLGSMLDARLSLDLLDYRSLLDARVDLFAFGDSLARSLRLTGSTYRDVMRRAVPVSTVTASLADAVALSGGTTGAASALRDVTGSLAGARTSIDLSGLVDFGELGSGTAESTARPAGLSLQVFDLLGATARLASGGREIALDLGAQLGVANLAVRFSTGERAQTGSWTSVSGRTAVVRTAQTRLLLSAQIDVATIGRITLPIYLQAAEAAVTLTDLHCPRSDADRASAVLSAQTALAGLAVAAVPASATASPEASPYLGTPATLLSLPLVTVTGAARTSVGSSNPIPVGFSDTDIATGRTKTVRATQMVGSTLSSLLSSLSVRIDLSVSAAIGLNGSALQGAVLAAVSTATPSLDGVLDGLLRTLGVGLGQADLWVNGVSCSRAALVQ